MLLLPAGGRDGPLRCDWEEEAKSERGQRELGVRWGPRSGGCELAAAAPARGHLRDRREGEAGLGVSGVYGGLKGGSRAAGDSGRQREAAGGSGRQRCGAGEASGRAAGRREPLTCAAEEAELQQPMAGPEEPGGGARRAATPRSPSACEPAGARGGRGLAPHGSAAAAAARVAADTQEAARLGAGACHIPRRRRLRGSCSAPAAAAAPQRKGAGGGGGGASPCPPPPASRAQSLSRSLSRAAASSAPRSSPIRLPAPSAAPRRLRGGGGQNEAGLFGERRSLRSAEPI